ncbi:MAG: putative spermidine/putrescine transport system ATP-binding protein [Rhodospirillaceae bacterium]|nr:putative spermidine/putrescine transport system ATP-binding protein [Rhodospirillaceae bacterium]
MNKDSFDRSASSPVTAPSSRCGARVVYDRVTKQYGTLHALFPTSLEIESGEFFSIIGPSGSGKTTLLGVTAGFIPPTDGQILVDGRDLVGIPPFQRNIGMVFQNYSLFPHMTVAQNIGFPLRMRKIGRAEADERIKRMLGVVRLGGMAERYPTQLSGGQQQRVALARAAVYDPVLLLMDEPLSALDKNLREEMQREIKAFQQALGTTVIYVTHDQYEASSMSHRIAIMNGGRVAQIGSPRELYEHPRNRFVASFLGEANLFEVTRHEPAAGNQTLVETGQGFRIHAAGRPAPGAGFVLCVRPERISVSPEKTLAANQLAGTVTDVVYSSGTAHYRIRVAPDMEINQKIQAGSMARQFEVGETVHLSWDASDSQLIAEE